MKKFLFILLAAALLLPTTATAATFRTGDTLQTSSRDTITDNLYAAGGTVSLNSTVEGDAYAVGGMITVSAPVRDDLLIGGGNINIIGDVGQDLRVVGGNIIVNGDVGGEVIVVGGTVQLLGSEVQRDVTVAGGFVSINGTIHGNLTVNGGEVHLNGTVEGAVAIDAEDPLQIGADTVVNGPFIYKGMEEAKVADGAKLAQGLQFEQWEKAAPMEKRAKKIGGKALGLMSMAFLIKLIITLIAAFILVAIFPKCVKLATERSMKSYWMNVLYGLVIAIVVPIVGIVLLVTILGSLAGGLLLIAYGLALGIAKVLAGILLGVWLLKVMSKKKKEVAINWKPILLGTIVIHLLLLIPILGWLAACLFFLAAFGGLSLHFYHEVVKKQ